MTSSSDSPAQRFVAVARILRARGNKGEVAAELLTDFPDHLKGVKELFLGADSQVPRKVALQSFWLDRNHLGQAVFHFEGVSSIEAAEKLRGLLIQIPFEQRAVLPSGSYFVTDLIGCSIFELPWNASPLTSMPCALNDAPSLLGQVRDVFFPGEGQPGTPLLSVETSRGEILIPLAEDICTRIDVAARRIEVLLPDGLHELNE